MVNVKGTRKYSSPVRDEQAARTRTRILDAASDLFLERGYARTTMQDIADLAGVARDTVHAVFGSKAQVLTALIDLRLVPDDSVPSVRERADVLAIKQEVDQHKQVELFGTFIASVSTELRPVFEILRTASAVEPEMADVFEEMDRFRMANMQTYARWIAARGPLRVSTRKAGEIIWAADTLARTLLPDA
jgi:AcrR family transcriptional regulator